MHSRSFALAVVFVSLAAVISLLADHTPPDVRASAPSLPTGNSTPEGAAADLIRSYINQDSQLFNSTRHIRMCEGRDNPAKYYAAFLENASFTNGTQSYIAGTLPSPVIQIERVNDARDVPASYKADLAYLAYTGVEARVVVDVGVLDSEGIELTHSTIVEQYAGGSWHAVPALSEWHSKHASHASSVAAAECLETEMQTAK